VTPPRILLVGMMGCGKTTTGGIVARRLGWDYRDSDADVEALTGHTVPEIFANEGEAAFRKVEAEVLATACTSELPTVISVAGGAVLSADNRKLIRECGTVAWTGSNRSGWPNGSVTAPVARFSRATRARSWRASSLNGLRTMRRSPTP